jgi:hypothetical protein
MEEEIIRHPKFPNIVFKLIKTKEELLMCLKAYSETSVVENEFIKQMNISAKVFYEQGLLPYAD